MFYSGTLCVPFAFLIALVAAVSAAPAISTTPSLSVRTSTSNVSVDGLENLKITATIVNTGDETIKLLNNPRGVLNSWPENSFTITGFSGSSPPFSGGLIDYDSTRATGLDHPGPFTILAPGESINVTHDLSAAYSFAQSGAGDYSIEPSGRFTYIDAEGTPKDLYATVEGIAKIKLSDNLSASRAVHDKRLNWKMRSKPKFENCSPQRQRILELSIVAAKNTATKAYRAARRIKGPSAQYTTWFGTYDTKRKKTVVATFRKMKNYISKLTYECGCGEDEDYNHSGLSASPMAAKPKLRHKNMQMRVCEDFWDLSANREAALIHESIHLEFIGNGAKDYAYGKERTLSLAKTNPVLAVKNVDSYKFFALGVRR